MDVFGLKITKSKKDNTVAIEESCRCRALKKHIETLEELQDGYIKQIKNLSEITAKSSAQKSRQSTEEKLLDIGAKIFLNDSKPFEAKDKPTSKEAASLPPQVSPAPEGDVSREDIMSVINMTNPSTLQQMVSYPKSIVAIKLRQNIPAITDELIDFAIDYTKTMLEKKIQPEAECQATLQ